MNLMNYDNILEFDKSTFNIFNINKMREYIVKQGIIDDAIGVAIGKHIGNVTESLFNNVVLPLFKIDLNKDGNGDFNLLENYKFNLFNVKINIGKFIVDFIKFIVILYLLILIARFVKDLID